MLRPCSWDKNTSEPQPTDVTFGSLLVPDEPLDLFGRNKVSRRRKLVAPGWVGDSVCKDVGHSPHSERQIREFLMDVLSQQVACFRKHRNIFMIYLFQTFKFVPLNQLFIQT